MRKVVVVDEGDDGARLDGQDIRLEGVVVDAHRRLWRSCFGVAEEASGGEYEDPRAAVAARHQIFHCKKAPSAGECRVGDGELGVADPVADVSYAEQAAQFAGRNQLWPGRGRGARRWLRECS